MHLMLQQDTPDDYVVSSGESHSVELFLLIAFRYSGLGDYNKYIRINPIFYRPCLVDCLLGNNAKIKSIGWLYNITFNQLIENMIDQLLGKPNKFI